MIKESIQEEDIILINIYTTNTVAPIYIKQIVTGHNRKVDNNTIIVGDFNTHINGQIKREKINKATVVLNYTIDQLNMIRIYRTFHPKTAE